jgi:hypothetical protein
VVEARRGGSRDRPYDQITYEFPPRRRSRILISDNVRVKAMLASKQQYADFDVIIDHALTLERKLGEIRHEAVGNSAD